MRIHVGSSILICLLAFGCSGGSRIHGKWENKEVQETYVFGTDGKYEYAGPGPVRGLLGPYRVERNRVILTATMPDRGGQLRDRTTVYEFSIDADVLTLSHPVTPGVTYSQPPVRYTRVKE